MNANAIDLRNLWFRYTPERPVLRGLDLAVPQGTILGMLGKNGAGKTTTFRILCGLVRQEQGDVFVNGLDASRHKTDVQRTLAFIPASPLLYDQLSAEENLNMFSLLWGLDPQLAQQRSADLLSEVGLWSVRSDWVESYSTGMKQRLSICAALILEPSVLVMDEPFNGLDFDATLWARQLLKKLADAGKTIVFSSHVPEVVEGVATDVAILDEGRIVEYAPINRVSQLGGILKFIDRKTQRPCA